jgi:putative nucleotidyltransferase with HDIG domain
MDRKSIIYVLAVVAIAAVVSALWLPFSDLADLSGQEWRAVGVFAFLGIAAQWAAIDIGSGRQSESSLAFIPFLATAVVFPPVASLLVCSLVIAISEFAFIRRPPLKAAFNISQIVLAVSSAALAYEAVAPGVRDGIVARGVVGAVVVFFAVNLLLSSVGLALYRNQPLWPTLRAVVGPRGGNLLYDLASSPLVIMTVAVYYTAGTVGVAFTFFPLLLLRESYARHQKLAHANRDLLYALVKAIETRDPYTSGHSIRVATLAKLIAEDLRLRGKRVDRVWTAALLHDVGKIDPIYSLVIQKPHDLTPEERSLIQTHSAKGADMLRDMGSVDKEVVAAVRHHHERFDGRGYPDGIKGSDIPLEARIIMMSDSIDAMLSDRPYRAALSIGQVKAELLKCQESQFDPALVDTVLRARTLEKAVALVAEWRNNQSTTSPMLAVLG